MDHIIDMPRGASMADLRVTAKNDARVPYPLSLPGEIIARRREAVSMRGTGFVQSG